MDKITRKYNFDRNIFCVYCQYWKYILFNTGFCEKYKIEIKKYNFCDNIELKFCIFCKYWENKLSHNGFCKYYNIETAKYTFCSDTELKNNEEEKNGK